MAVALSNDLGVIITGSTNRSPEFVAIAASLELTGLALASKLDPVTIERH